MAALKFVFEIITNNNINHAFFYETHEEASKVFNELSEAKEKFDRFANRTTGRLFTAGDEVIVKSIELETIVSFSIMNRENEAERSTASLLEAFEKDKALREQAREQGLGEQYDSFAASRNVTIKKPVAETKDNNNDAEA